MYEAFFDLATRPFTAASDPDAVVPVATARDALDALIHCISQGRGVGVMTADSGLGKTILCKRLARLLKQECLSVHLSSSSLQTRRSLLQRILYELEISYTALSEQEARLRLFEAARQSGQQGQFLLVIMDDAHLLPPRLFEELRTLTEYAPEGTPLIRVVLSGEFELEEKLADPALSALQQRIGCQVCLEPFTLEQSAEFVVERLRRAGGSNLTTLLTEEALEAICRASDGNPRCLCQLADHSFLLAFAEEQRPVDRRTVLAALDDLKELPLHWNELYDDSVEAGDELFAHAAAGDEDQIEGEPHAPLEDTAEFEIPEFLRKQVTEPATASSAPGESLPVDLDIEYAVIEVGKGIEDADSLTALPVPSREAMPSCDIENSDMTETPVVDHYALLDRLSELPERFRNEFIWSLPPDWNQSVPEEDGEPLEAFDTPHISDLVPVSGQNEHREELETQLLGTISDLRQEIGDAVDDARMIHDARLAWEGTEFPYDIVQPGPPLELYSDPVEETVIPQPFAPSEVSETVQEESVVQPIPMEPTGAMDDPEWQPTAQAAPMPVPESRLPQEPAPPARRFELLFTRLRRRRKRLQAEYDQR